METEESRTEKMGPPASSRRLSVEPSPRWVRVEFSGQFIADSRSVLLMRPSPRPPSYYFPRGDVRTDLLRESEKVAHYPDLGRTQYWTLEVGDRTAEDSVMSHTDLPDDLAALRDHIAFKWNLMDAWYEEDERVFVHPRDPYKRVDVLSSTRHVQVVVDGVQVAESRRPYLLFETHLPTRYYLPRTDVRMDLLEASDSESRCPYKGKAEYYNLRLGEDSYPDLVWTYQEPIPECPKIAGLLAFYNEKVDLIVDGQRQDRPKTPWS